MSLKVEKSGKISANIQQLLTELERQIKECCPDECYKVEIVIDSEGLHETWSTMGSLYAKQNGVTQKNLRGDIIK